MVGWYRCEHVVDNRNVVVNDVVNLCFPRKPFDLSKADEPKEQMAHTHTHACTHAPTDTQTHIHTYKHRDTETDTQYTNSYIINNKTGVLCNM